MIKETPTVITDRNGKIIFINEAAHGICAALVIGDNIRNTPTAYESYKGSVRGTRTFYLAPKKAMPTPVSYDELKTVILDKSKLGIQSKLRFSELYEALLSNLHRIGSDSSKTVSSLSEFTEDLISSVLPRLLYAGGNAIYTKDPSVTASSVIFAEVCGLYMILSAVFSVLSVADSDITFSCIDLGDKAEFSFRATVKLGKSYESPTDFGVRSADLLFAEALSRASGYEFSIFHDRVKNALTVSVCVPSLDYYPEYLKTDAKLRFTLSFISQKLHYPPLTKE